MLLGWRHRQLAQFCIGNAVAMHPESPHKVNLLAMEPCSPGPLAIQYAVMLQWFEII